MPLFATLKKTSLRKGQNSLTVLVNQIQDDEIIKQNKERFPNHDLNKIKIKSGKKTICGDKVYETLYDFRGRKNSDDFFLDLDWFMVYSDSDE